MRLLGQISQGVYVDEYDDVNPHILEQFYGVVGKPTVREAGQTGAGHGSDDDEDFTQVDADEDWVDEDEAHAETQPNIRHEPVPVPSNNNPFTSAQFQHFNAAFHRCMVENLLPSGYGICPEEWVNGTYPTMENIPTGRRGSKELSIRLTDEIWRPRAEKWVRGLYLLNCILNE